jgi:hypothetical protein
VVRFNVTAPALAAALLLLGPAGVVESVQAADKLPCESQARPGDKLNIACPLAVSGTTQRFRFKADFSGSHDDTIASMTATLGEIPLVCEKGSKTRTMGEDGDVSLECVFAVDKSAGARIVLKVDLAWSHAQYEGFEVVAE